MKIRTGFVSNSSSSSFIIFGKYFQSEEFQKKFNLTDEDMEDIGEMCIEDAGCFDEKIKDNLNGLEVMYCDGNYLIGDGLGSSRETIIKSMDNVIKILGVGCQLFSGIDCDGEISFD